MSLLHNRSAKKLTTNRIMMNVVRKVRVCVMMAQFSSCPQLCTLHNFSCCRLPTQLFTTSETGETFSILKTLFKSLAGAEPGCLACCCSC